MLQMVEMEELDEQFGNSDGDGEVQIPSRGRRFGSSGPGVGPGEGIRAGQAPCGVGLGDGLQFPMEDLAGALRVF